MERLDLDGLTITPERIDAAISRAKNDLVGPEALRQAGGRPRLGDRRQGLRRLPEEAPRLVGRRLRRPARPRRDHPEGAHRTSAPSSTPGSATSWSTSTRTRTWPSTRSSGRSRSTTPTSASPATPTSRSTAGGGRTSTTSSNSSSDFPGCKVVKLEQNYRSTKNILRVADHLIRFNRRRKPKSLTTENPDGAAGRADRLRDRDRRGPRRSPRKIVELVQRGARHLSATSPSSAG